MPNMSYTRFHNTLIDLRDCQEALEMGETDDLSAEEERAKTALIALCGRIYADFGDE